MYMCTMVAKDLYLYFERDNIICKTWYELNITPREYGLEKVHSNHMDRSTINLNSSATPAVLNLTTNISF